MHVMKLKKIKVFYLKALCECKGIFKILEIITTWVKKMAGHHLILGQLADYITGEILEDTHDERYRQKLARLLVKEKGYPKKEIHPRFELLIKADDKAAIIKIDFTITLSGKVCMIIKYGPGSLVTRRCPVLAASRLVVPYQVPYAVVTNGKDAEILESSSGKVVADGLEGIFDRERLIEASQHAKFGAITPKAVEMASRILYCYEVDDSCPCDDTICKL